MSNISRQRILNVMGTFRPAFRTVAQSLTDIDLVLVEEAFERLLLVSFPLHICGLKFHFLCVHFLGLPVWDFMLVKIVICAANPTDLHLKNSCDRKVIFAQDYTTFF